MSLTASEISATSDRPRLVIPVGDPAGIGPEVVLKALADPRLSECSEVTVVGNREHLLQTYQHLCQQSEPGDRPLVEQLAHPEALQILEIPWEAATRDQIQWGVGNAASGAVSFQALETAIAYTLAGEFDGIVTGPIAKSAWKAAGHDYPGQTELLAERAGVQRFGMLFVARSPQNHWTLRALLATTHIPLRQVPDALTPELLTRKLELLMDCLRDDFGLAAPKIAIAGLNPHSGEQGQLGIEELQWITPWLEQMRDRYPHLRLDGPVPPDTLWVAPGQAWFASPETPVAAHDAYLALYHDQGLIPVKLLAFDRAVNTTIGLPFIRTSPDHGTAFDIAGKGFAQATSMEAAIRLAQEITGIRQT